MKIKSESAMVEREFCKRTDKLAHNRCIEKIIRRVPKDKVFELCEFHKKLRTKKENIEIYRIMEDKYKAKNGKYKIKEALRCKFIAKKICEDPNEPYLEDYQKLGRLLYRVKRQKEKQILKEIFPRPRTINRLCDEIENLIIQGEHWNKKTLRKLQRSCHLYGDDKEKIEEDWKRISEDFKGITPEQISQLRLFKKHQPLKGRRTIKRPKPFDEFNIYLVLTAKKKGIINGREARILKYRYNLEDQGIKSLRLIAGWLGISHTSVRNIENRALKKLQKNKNELMVDINKPKRREATKEEYKRRYGYYPD